MPSILERWKFGLAKSRKSILGQLVDLFGAKEINEGLWEKLETILIQADLGYGTTVNIINTLKEDVKEKRIADAETLFSRLKLELRNRLGGKTDIRFESKPAIILLVGVNGSGKTTVASKLGYLFASQGLKVLLVAADTFRAAAIEQLQSWGLSLGIDVYSGDEATDPGSVVFDGIQFAINKHFDLVIVDTAGRLHTRYNLMEELKKIQRVAGKSLPGAPHATWLVMDATTGQNALSQARTFAESVDVTGVILNKLDTSAKGGMILAIREVLKLPIIFVGMGERKEDLHQFEPELFIKGLLD